MNKEAVVFIVDANLTMNLPYPPQPSSSKDGGAGESNSSTRLSQAKDAVLTSIIDLMWRSKTHEAGVVVLKAGVTHHHLSEIERITDDVDVGKFFRRCRDGYKLHRYDNGEEEDEDVFPNLVEFDLNRPNPLTLRALKHVSCTINESIASSISGDLCDGLILAADALHRRTNNKKYKRKIVMITDAEHEVEVNGEQLQCVLDGLNKMDVELIVLGIGFEENIMSSVPPIQADNVESSGGNTNEDDNNRKMPAAMTFNDTSMDIDEDDNGAAEKPEAVVSMNDNNNEQGEKQPPEPVVSMEENDNGELVKEEGNPDDMKLNQDWRQPNALFPGSNPELVTAFLHGDEQSKVFSHFNDPNHASNWANKYFGGSNGRGHGDGSGYSATAVASQNDEGRHIVTVTKTEDACIKPACNDIDSLIIKRENEKLLVSIARETGGCILAANGVNLTELLQSKLPVKAGTKKSAARKVEFRLAPGMTMEVKNGKLTDKFNIPTTKKEAYQIHPETGEKLRDGTGELMTLPTRTDTRHYDSDDNEVPIDKRTDAYRKVRLSIVLLYGSDLIPVCKMDMLGLNAAFADPGSIEMIGYLDRKDVDSSKLLMGPAYAFTGGDSKKARTAIAALSQALEETNKVGFCRIVRTKNGEPKIGALLPKMEGCDDGTVDPNTKGKGGRYLAFLEMPFADDIQHHQHRDVPEGFKGDYKDEMVCDNLIDSMMLQDDEFQSEDVSFPALKAHQRMVAFYAINPLDEKEEMQEEGLAPERIKEASQATPLCDLDAVKTVAKKASKQISAFNEKYPLVEHKPEDAKKKKFWGDTTQ